MERATVDPDDAGSDGGGPDDGGPGDDVDRVDLGDGLDAADLAAVQYRLAPGEGFPSGLHAHDDQEEVFVVLDGTAAFEYLPPTESWDGESPTGREFALGPGEAVRFAHGEFQTGRNPASADGDSDDNSAVDDDVVALALGAPRDTSDVRIPASCPECEGRTLRLGTDGDTFTFDCPECEASFAPAPCEACGSHDLGMHLDDDDHPVSRCADCGSEFPHPPLAD